MYGRRKMTAHLRRQGHRWRRVPWTGQRIAVGIACTADEYRNLLQHKLFRESNQCVLTRSNRSTNHLNDGGAFDRTTTGPGGSVDGAGGDGVKGRPPVRLEPERAFWVQIACALTSEDAAVAYGVSGPSIPSAAS